MARGDDHRYRRTTQRQIDGPESRGIIRRIDKDRPLQQHPPAHIRAVIYRTIGRGSIVWTLAQQHPGMRPDLPTNPQHIAGGGLTSSQRGKSQMRQQQQWRRRGGTLCLRLLRISGGLDAITLKKLVNHGAGQHHACVVGLPAGDHGWEIAWPMAGLDILDPLRQLHGKGGAGSDGPVARLRNEKTEVHGY